MKLKSAIALIALGMTSAVSAEELTGTLAKVAETKSITIGYRESGIPLSYVDDQQKPIGYAVELCAQVAQAVKTHLGLSELSIRYTEVNGSTRIPLISNGAVDLECGTTTNNLERQKQVAFSTTTFIAAARFASKVTDNLKVVADLKGKGVTANAGSNNLELVNKLNTSQNLGLRILPAKDFGEAFLMLETGRASAFVLDDILLAGVVANSKDPSRYVISNEALTAEPYAIMLRKDDPAFKKVVDESLAALYQSGEAGKLYSKWFESPIPPRGINLHLPASKALQALWRHPSDSADPSTYNAE